MCSDKHVLRKPNVYLCLISHSRKFADIANTVQKQFQAGVYKISDWADLVTAHALPGPDMITNMYGDKNGLREKCGCVVILGMSTKNALTNQEYSEGIQISASTSFFAKFLFNFSCCQMGR